MKTLQIFGVIVAIHIVVIALAIVPGCSAPRKTPVRSTPGATIVGGEPSPVSPAPASSTTQLSPVDINPGTAGSPDWPVSAPGTGSPVSPSPASGGQRYSPTRPGSTTAQVVTPAPVTDVTPARTYTVVSGDSLWKIAHANNTSVAELAAANNLARNAALKIGQKLIIPQSAAASSTSSEAGGASSAEAGTTYTVRAGDTLGAIARRHGTSVAAIKALNNLRSDLVRVGQELKIPTDATMAGAGTTTTAATGDFGPGNNEPAPARATAGGSGTPYVHVVARGESLGEIARRYGTTIGKIATANSISDPGKIREGQKLTIPGWTAPASGAAPAATRPEDTPATLPMNPADTPAQPAPPPPDQDLDAGLRNRPPSDVPVITPTTEDQGPIITPAPERRSAPEIN